MASRRKHPITRFIERTRTDTALRERFGVIDNRFTGKRYKIGLKALARTSGYNKGYLSAVAHGHRKAGAGLTDKLHEITSGEIDAGEVLAWNRRVKPRASAA